jgi:hypothetical protein
LEELLKAKDASSATFSLDPSIAEVIASSSAPGGAAVTLPLGLDSGLIPDSYMNLQDAFPWQNPDGTEQDFTISPVAPSAPGLLFNATPLGAPLMMPTPETTPPTTYSTMIDPSWPPNLPHMDLLLHLIDTFFTCVPHANRVLHRPTFMTALLNHPSAIEFP